MKKRILPLAALLLTCAMPAIAEHSAGQARAIPYSGVKLSDNLIFTGTAYVPDDVKAYTFSAMRRPFDNVSLTALVDPSGSSSWTREERTFLRTPDTFYTNELGDWMATQDGMIHYMRADVNHIVDGHLMGELSFLTGHGNRQSIEIIPWDSTRNPSADVAFSSSTESGSLLSACVDHAKALLKQLCGEQTPVLVREEAVTAGEHSFRILAFGFQYRNILIYGPTELRLPIINKDESESASQEYALLVYDNQGLCYMSVHTLLTPHSDPIEVPVMPFDAALTALGDALSAIPSSVYTLKQAWLTYLPVGDCYYGDVQFRPFWSFYVEYEMEYDDEMHMMASVARIDAQTGALLW